MTTDHTDVPPTGVDDVLAAIDDVLASVGNGAASPEPTTPAASQDTELPTPATATAQPPALPREPAPSQAPAPAAVRTSPDPPTRRPHPDDWWDPLFHHQDADLDTHTGNLPTPRYHTAEANAPQPAPAQTPPGGAPTPATPGTSTARDTHDGESTNDEGDEGPGDEDVDEDEGEDEEGRDEGRPRRGSFLRRPPAPPQMSGPVETVIRSAELDRSGWHTRRILWVLRWGTPALLGWGLGLGDAAVRHLAAFTAAPWTWAVMVALPAIPTGVLAWRARWFWPPLGWACRIPLATWLTAAFTTAPVHHRTAEGTHDMDEHVIIAADLGGGLNLGTVTAGGLAAVMTAFCVLYLKSGGESKYTKWVNTEFLMVFGFAASAFYETAGWSGPSDLILQLTSQWANSWGYGALAIIITGFLLLRKHSDKRAVIGGFMASTLYAAAGGSFAWPENLLTTLAQAIGLV
ncbi:hypothetical protein [Streptomyces sp. NPDC001889]